MDLFVSKYTNKIDKKGRVSLPQVLEMSPKASRNEIILYKSIKHLLRDVVLAIKRNRKKNKQPDFFRKIMMISQSIFSEIVTTNVDKKEGF